MCNKCDYTIHRRNHHFGWDNSFTPAERVNPGVTIEFECLDSSGGQFTATSTVADVPSLDFAKVNPVTGPIFVEGAEPGDALKVTIEEFKPSGFGWTANIPGLWPARRRLQGAGAQYLEISTPLRSHRRCSARTARVPLKPFAGTIGNAPAEKGHHSVVPPRRVGGNLDIRDLAAGTALYLPVEVAGALFSVGDTHAAQGDGEVCGTAIESPMNVVLTLDLVKDARLKTPRFTTPGPVTRHLDAKGYEVTTGVGPDLMEGAKAAVSQMVDLLGRPLQLGCCRRLHAVLGLRRSRGSAKSSTCRTGWCRSISRAACSSDGKPRSTILTVSNLTVSIRGEEGERRSSPTYHFDLSRGETLCIAGESGSGKSMTALAIMRPPAAAAQRASQKARSSSADGDLPNLPERQMRDIRGDRIAMIFQEPMTSLNPVLTIGQQLIEAILSASRGQAAKCVARAAIAALERRPYPGP